MIITFKEYIFFYQKFVKVKSNQYLNIIWIFQYLHSIRILQYYSNIGIEYLNTKVFNTSQY